MRKILFTIFIVFLGVGVWAQKSDGTTKSLVLTEKAFAEDVAKNGTKAAFNKFTASDGVVFKPNPINAKKYFETATDVKNISWKPTYARISRSHDWGFTSGNYTEEASVKKYGHYLSVWRGRNGKWEMILNLTSETNKTINSMQPVVVEPKDFYSPQFTTEKELKASREVINTTEKTLSTTLKSFGPSAFAGFLNKDAQLMFPGTDLIVGKDNIQAFCNRMIDKISLRTVSYDKALGGDLAYSFGLATIDYTTDLRESFNYIFIWERQTDGNWNIMSQIFTLAER